jgi:hypothetical protein
MTGPERIGCTAVSSCLLAFIQRGERHRWEVDQKLTALVQPFLMQTTTHQSNYIMCTMEIFPLTPMGVLAPRSAHARPSAQPPINVSGNFPAHMSAESPSIISPNPSEVISNVSEP